MNFSAIVRNRITALGRWRQTAYRRATARFRLLPEFVIIGAQRCGTTSLYSYLCEHPSILPAGKKGSALL